MQATRVAPTEPDTSPLTKTSYWRWIIPEDGWITVLLLAVMVYCVPWSIQNVTPAWAPGLDILTVTTAAGLVLGFLTAQQRFISHTLAHTIALAVGMIFAFQKTADAVLAGSRDVLWQHLTLWLHRTLVLHESSDDNSVFLLFLAVLTLLLAYLSIRLVLRIRQPWIAALANGVVLLINLNWATADKSLLLVVVFILSTLLLLVRFTLIENMRAWRARGLRFSRDLGWDFMQAGTIFAVIILIFANALPSLPVNTGIQDFFTSPTGPLQSIENNFQSVFGGVQGKNTGLNFFGSEMQLSQSVSLPNTPILRYSVPANGDASQYLITGVFSQYDGQNGWAQPPTNNVKYLPNVAQPASSSHETTDTYTITMIHPPAGAHIFAPGSEPASFSVESVVATSAASGMPISWDSTAFIGPGDKYVAKGYVSNATVQQLTEIPYPADLSGASLAAQYPDAVLAENLHSTPPIPKQVASLARQVTTGTNTMYDAAVALEDYLRQFTYTTTVQSPPSGENAIVWFLQQREGFCTYFASAMALMGRSLGMPTRIAEGFSTGKYDQATNSYIVTGQQSHVWTQIYFGQYGWINFEPTASFNKFNRAFGNSTGGNSAVPTGTATSSQSKGKNPQNDLQNLPDSRSRGGASAGGQTILARAGLSLSVIVILGLLALALFAIWWKRLYEGLSPLTRIFARLTRLGTWAGAPPAPSQTPHEYAEQLATILPGQREALVRLSEHYSRERWSNEADADAPDYQQIYDEVRTQMTPVILKRLRQLPVMMAQRAAHLAGRLKRIRQTTDSEMR